MREQGRSWESPTTRQKVLADQALMTSGYNGHRYHKRPHWALLILTEIVQQLNPSERRHHDIAGAIASGLDLRDEEEEIQ